MKKIGNIDDRDINDYRYMYNVSHENKVLHIYLTEEIDFDRDFIGLIKEIKALTEKDTIKIYINNYGGGLAAMIQLMNALKITPAKIEGYLEGYACSAASFIFLMCDKMFLNKYSILMLHYYSTGYYYQKGGDIEKATEFDKKHFQFIFSDSYKELMTEEELADMFNGKDFWFNSNQIKHRLKSTKKISMVEWVR